MQLVLGMSLFILVFGGAGALQARRGSACAGGAAGAALYIGILLPVAEAISSGSVVYAPSEYAGAYLINGAFAIAASVFTLLSARAQANFRMLYLLLAAAAALPVTLTLIWLMPLAAWGLGIVGIVPALVLLSDAVLGRLIGKNPWEPDQPGAPSHTSSQ